MVQPSQPTTLKVIVVVLAAMAAGANKVVAAKAEVARARVSSGVAVMAAIRVRIPERYQGVVKYQIICETLSVKTKVGTHPSY